MAKAENTYKKDSKSSSSKKATRKRKRISLFKDKRVGLSIGFFLIGLSVYFGISFVSYLFTGENDQSVVEAFRDTDIVESGSEARNWFGVLGAIIANQFIYKWFGLSAFIIPPLLFLVGYYVVFKKEIISLRRSFLFSVFFIFWTSTLLGYLTLDPTSPTGLSRLSGGIGYEIALLMESLFGWGAFIVLLLSLLIFVIFFFNITQLFTGLAFLDRFSSSDGSIKGEVSRSDEEMLEQESWVVNQKSKAVANEKNIDLEVEQDDYEDLLSESQSKSPENELVFDDIVPDDNNTSNSDKEEPDFSVGEGVEEQISSSIENYDPTLDLSSYKYPSLDLLNEYESGHIKVTKEELEQNKNKIVETLTNFKIGIASIKATIGPTVTLYEIIPDAGVKISKIKNLEDDIALSLAALGIRIIAPIPGKGTIGIEVPNKNREMVSMKSVLSTEKFSKSAYELPVVLGKTISNEVYVADLAKMPHLLMAGATGQGKSVGLNVMLASLIYKKHPSQLKFVLVDPKKVELTLFNKIERHFLATLPDSEEAIITDTKKVIYTLNALCIEMDDRLSLLKDAGCRNLKEYNKKFIQRSLNPQKGHRYLPYIVLVIDELADLMVTAGKEVENPIARLAAVARAIGIHLILATQRPSVNVITGVIKANFPARLSFRVTSKIDSRTILDMGGADQLVGMGDMLFSLGSELIRLQCPFIDTAEVENVCDFVGEQRGYESAYMLPEYSGDEEAGASGAVDLADRDSMFEEAARLIVRHQQGSTSLIQRKLKLGYNRAGRLIDQLEAAGIVGPFEGSKARDVLITDEYSLEQKLNEIYQNN